MATTHTETISLSANGVTVTCQYTMAVPVEWQAFDLNDWANPAYPDTASWDLTGNIVITFGGTGSCRAIFMKPQGSSKVPFFDGTVSGTTPPASFVAGRGQAPRVVFDLLGAYLVGA